MGAFLFLGIAVSPCSGRLLLLGHVSQPHHPVLLLLKNLRA
jgi:hypothetical protein